MRFLLQNRRAIVLLIFLTCSLFGFLIYSMPCTYANMAHKYMRMVCIAGAVSTICAVQIVCFLSIKDNKIKTIQRIRKRLLLLAKNIHKNKYLYSLIEWGLFSLTFIPYIIVAVDFGELCGVLLFVILWYIFIQKIWLTGIKFLYFYFVASPSNFSI